MWPVRIIALLGCAEWLLIFRTWVSFRYLLLYAGFAALRLLYLMKFLPHWDSNYILIMACFPALLWHLRSLWRASTSQNQQTYDTPETGVPWLVIVTRNRQFAFGLECAIITGFIVFMAELRPSHPTAGLAIAFSGQRRSPGSTLSGCSLPIRCGTSPSRASRYGPPARRRPDPYQYVREQNHSPPPLPSVRDLSDDLSNLDS